MLDTAVCCPHHAECQGGHTDWRVRRAIRSRGTFARHFCLRAERSSRRHHPHAGRAGHRSAWLEKSTRGRGGGPGNGCCFFFVLPLADVRRRLGSPNHSDAPRRSQVARPRVIRGRKKSRTESDTHAESHGASRGARPSAWSRPSHPVDCRRCLLESGTAHALRPGSPFQDVPRHRVTPSLTRSLCTTHPRVRTVPLQKIQDGVQVQQEGGAPAQGGF